MSPHPNQITAAAIAGDGGYLIPEYTIVRALMRGRYQFFTGQSKFIHDIISADVTHVRPSNFICVDILEYLIRYRKERVEFNQEGYFSIRKLVNEMSRLGYDESDAHSAILKLIKNGLAEPESLVETELTMDEPVRAHASGYVHSRLLLRQIEYLIGSTMALNTASKEVSTDIGNIWAGWDPRYEMGWANKVRILTRLRDYLRLEYQRRCRLHVFYEEFGYGGKHLLKMVENAHSYMEDRLRNPRQDQRAYVPARQRWYDDRNSIIAPG